MPRFQLLHVHLFYIFLYVSTLYMQIQKTRPDSQAKGEFYLLSIKALSKGHLEVGNRPLCTSSLRSLVFKMQKQAFQFFVCWSDSHLGGKQAKTINSGDAGTNLRRASPALQPSWQLSLNSSAQNFTVHQCPAVVALASY